MIYVIGGNGFVGSAFVRLLQVRDVPHSVVTRANFDSLRGTACEILVNANGNSKKYISDREPMTDFDMSVRSVADSLHAFKSDHYVLLSSGDVYADPSAPQHTREDSAIDLAALSRYGRHKRLAEELVAAEHVSWLILRMGGFVGPGLKKNAIYDILHGAPLWLTLDSALQFISTDRAAALAWRLVERGVRREIVNFGARGIVSLRDVCDWAGSTSEVKEGARHVRYELNLDELERLAGESLPRTHDEVRTFVAQYAPAAQQSP